MTAQRIAGFVALGSGLLLVLALVASALAGPTALASTSSGASWPMGPGTMGAGHMGNGMMRMGPGMMGFGTSDPASTPIPNATEVRVQAANFTFTPNEVLLPKNADVNLTFTNPRGTGVVHDFTVPAIGIHVVANPGETKTVGLRGLAVGRYEAYCSVPGHGELGMRATVVVE
ncbi:MAG TPA: cupredoxin domain-containing protein [Candidatus Limnocylindria bacterium]|nr:cupredoxin domain-containing protein [Candidatus Limnocylindria bacterium]